MATEFDPSELKAPVNNPLLTPAEAAKGYDTVTMEFENPVTLTIGNWEGKVHYPKGAHEVPREWKDHWFLKAHGAKLKGTQSK